MARIRVTAKVDHFRRAGLAFDRAGVDLDTAKLGTAQFAALEAEPLLVVTPIDDKSDKKGKKD